MKRITVLGAGTMGRQIASMFAAQGYVTRLYDANPRVTHDVKAAFGDRDNLEFCEVLADAVTDSDFVIESINEDLSEKRALYANIAPYLKSSAIVGSNTSSFSLKELTSPSLFPNAFALVHFFNPADIIPLVEVVKPINIEDTAFQEIIDLLRSCKKTPVILKKDVPGFIANRLQSAVLREACHLVSSGIANEEDVDTAMREGIGLRWACAGPFQIADFGGLDIWSKVIQALLHELDASVDVPKLITEQVSQGKLGQKSGIGFYRYHVANGAELTDFRNEILRLLAGRKHTGNNS